FCYLIFFFQAEDGIRDLTVTGVQTCALPIFIMMSQNRQVHKDRLRANLDYQVNLKNELLLSDIIRRLDEIAKRKPREEPEARSRDRKSTRLNSSHSQNSYAVFCLIKINIFYT